VLLCFPQQITIREVGPRDGLQAEAPLAVGDRVRLIESLIAAGVSSIEVCSFVSPKAVPAMIGGAEVIAAVGVVPGVRRAALVPNLRGARAALEAGVDELTGTVSVSEAYSAKNVKMSVAESVSAMLEVCALATGSAVPVDVVLSFCFGSPYEGEIAPSSVVSVASSLLAGGATRVTFADTTGCATPARVGALMDAVPSSWVDSVGMHLHDTRGTALVNAYAAMQRGVARFDTSIGGLGGSPFANGAGGNLATEDLVHLCDDLGIHTRISLDRLLESSALVTALVGREVPSRIAAHGPRSRAFIEVS
jgi:hydroxymethylglutaryl-CoA lyase